MKIAIGSDERTNLTDRILEELKQRGHEVIVFGSLAENDLSKSARKNQTTLSNVKFN
jgi:ribose 5-phosphate isomerase RpiB